LLGTARAVDELAHAAGRPELGVPVALDTTTGDDVARPYSINAETVVQQRVRRVRARHVGSSIRELVAELRHDLDHAVERVIYEEDVVVERDHCDTLVGVQSHRSHWALGLRKVTREPRKGVPQRRML